MATWFTHICRSEAAAAELKPSGALAGRGRAWLVEPCTVSGSGQTSNCGGQLQALDLEEHEWEQFAEGIAQLATKQERKPKDFQAFKVRIMLPNLCCTFRLFGNAELLFCSATEC